MNKDSHRDSSGDASLGRRAVRAIFWTVVGIGGGRALRLVSSLVLTRLLFPEAFGLMALVTIFVEGLGMFADVGVGPSIIQNPRGDDPQFLNTAWSVQIVRGLVIWVACVAVAVPVARFYGEPQLAALIPVVGLSAIIGGLQSTAIHTVNRRLELHVLTLLELIAQGSAIAVAIGWAWLSPTVWALVAGSLTSALVRMTLSHFLLKGHRNRLEWDPSAARELYRFGKWIFASTALGFLGVQADRLVLGRLLSLEILGVYSIAFTLVSIPDALATTISGRVIFPAISLRADLPRSELRKLLLSNRWRVLPWIAVGLSLLTCVGDLVVPLLYDPRYHDAGWMFSILSMGLWARGLTTTSAPALLAIGQSRYFAASALLRLAWIVLALPVANLYFGLPGAVWVAASGPFLEYAIQALGLARHGLFRLRQDGLATVIWAACLLIFLLGRSALGIGLPFASRL